ncbi:DUF4183 domain-containing protein [Paenibacillus athensensis]|uniref:DUF4183 domain-containing protein n=1 Tax=Paenibacillus athensensis TaxID=1967502 RepID=A0A4Y8PWH9_9BACL|nr:DUF4183 domain-containing protein [Paenibacillus athensensis]MCD1261495.1 DUF4183 domain-containing protein [Paenibacillus athensensis]
MRKKCTCRAVCTCRPICRPVCKRKKPPKPCPRPRPHPRPRPRPKPRPPAPKPLPPTKLRTEISTFYAVADGQQKSFVDQNAVEGYSSSPIPDPQLLSYTNVFVNGVLQPASLYTQRSGEITLLTSDAPAKGTPVIAQFVRILR